MLIINFISLYPGHAMLDVYFLSTCMMSFWDAKIFRKYSTSIIWLVLCIQHIENCYNVNDVVHIESPITKQRERSVSEWHYLNVWFQSLY